MLSLDDPRWRALTQAYGSAEDVPRVLTALAATADQGARAALWFALWRMLHRPDAAYTAAYAAAPHLLSAAAQRDLMERATAVHLVTRIELSRRAPGSATVPADLVAAYAAAIDRLPEIVAEAVGDVWSGEIAPLFAAALLVGKRQPELADAVLRAGLGERATTS